MKILSACIVLFALSGCESDKRLLLTMPLFEWCEPIINRESKTRTLLNEVDIEYEKFTSVDGVMNQYKSNIIGVMEVRGNINNPDKRTLLTDTLYHLCVPTSYADESLDSIGFENIIQHLHAKGPENHIYIDINQGRIRAQTLPKN